MKSSQRRDDKRGTREREGDTLINKERRDMELSYSCKVGSYIKIW